jgi:hypothetical protein
LPDLTNRFVVGANEDIYNPFNGKFTGPGSTVSTSTTSTQGGTADLIVPKHVHTATFAGELMPPHTHGVTESAHTHAHDGFSYILRAPYGGSLTGNDTTGSGSEQAVGPGDGADMAAVKTGITINSTSSGVSSGTVAVSTAGSVATGMNVPPYTALYYIMKIAGTTATNAGIVML